LRASVDEVSAATLVTRRRPLVRVVFPLKLLALLKIATAEAPFMVRDVVPVRALSTVSPR